MRASVLPGALSCVFAAFLLNGCSAHFSTAPVQAVSGNATGRVFGGQQPVSGATIQLYTVGTSGDGSASTPLLGSPVITDANGNFNITNLYSCSGATEVYLTATGGNAGLSTANPNLLLIAALGPCSSLTSGTYITLNELTTVAAVSALSPFMSSATAIGSGSADSASLVAAFTLASELVNTATGTAPGVNLPSGDGAPSALINTLGDIVAACVNSTGGVAGDNSPCGNLFALTTPQNGTAPTDTVGALLNLVNNPSLNTTGLFALSTANGPFQPQLPSAPTGFQVTLTRTLSSMIVNPSPATLAIGVTQQLTVQGTYTDGTSGNVTQNAVWSDDSSVTPSTTLYRACRPCGTWFSVTIRE